MTQEQKDWYNYGRLKAAWLAVRELEPGEEHILTPTLWDARRKAYRWNVKHTCENCKYFDKADFTGCYACNSGANWEPID